MVEEEFIDVPAPPPDAGNHAVDLLPGTEDRGRVVVKNPRASVRADGIVGRKDPAKERPARAGVRDDETMLHN